MQGRRQPSAGFCGKRDATLTTSLRTNGVPGEREPIQRAHPAKWALWRLLFLRIICI